MRLPVVVMSGDFQFVQEGKIDFSQVNQVHAQVLAAHCPNHPLSHRATDARGPIAANYDSYARAG